MAVFVAVAAVSFVGCDKMPLVAPTGSVITLFAASTTVPVTGEVEIVATVIEHGVTQTTGTGTTPGTGNGTGTTSAGTAGAGTPVQNGTLISFTTTIGQIQPREARTNNGEVRVKFIADGRSGLATITAYSGGTSAKLENLKVGSAAVERVTLTASPQTLGPSGGAAVISAHVQDASGLGVAGIPVDFTADAGLLSAGTATTDQNGVASVTLTTTRQSKVSANVAGKTADVTVGLNPRTGLTITGPSTSVPAGTPATFTVNVASTANIRDVTIDFGDGSSQSLGAISGSTTAPHTYLESGTYTVSATAIDASGFSERVMTGLTVLPAQPPSVIVTSSNSNPSVGESVILTAQVSGNTSTIISYEWSFDAGGVPATAKTTSNRVPVRWTSTGTKVITVRAIQATGPTGEGFGTVVVKP